jgi:multiple sugar transport system ATP-binding protein
MASVTYDHVVKRYTADLTVVKDFNVEIKDKEFMVLVGPSGCGKSTALRMLAGLEAITEGQIRIGDRVVNNVAAKDRDIAMVFQSYALYPHMSVYDNMAFPLQMQHMKKDEIEKRVKNASRILGLDNFLKRKPRALSSRSPTSTPSCAGRPASSCRSCTATWRRPSSTSRTTRSRR